MKVLFLFWLLFVLAVYLPMKLLGNNYMQVRFRGMFRVSYYPVTVITIST